MKLKLIFWISLFWSLIVFADELPDLGDSSQLILTVKEEQATARAILKEVAESPEIVHDIEVIDYLKNLGEDRKSTRLNSSHIPLSRMPSSA